MNPDGFDANKGPYQIRLREAWRTLVYLYRHPYDTTQIARVIEALSGRSVQRLLRRLRVRPRGKALLEARPSLRKALADRDYLASLPDGSLGRAYLEYLATEKIFTTMTDYVDSGTSVTRTDRLPDDERFIQDFLFHSHDLYHLVAGYRTDLVGEVCLLAFTAPQTRNTGVMAMTLLGLYSLRLPRLRGQRLALRAFVRALRAEWLPEQNWVELLPEPLEQVRRRLRLLPVPSYTPLYVGKGQSKRRSKTNGQSSSATSAPTDAH